MANGTMYVQLFIYITCLLLLVLSSLAIAFQGPRLVHPSGGDCVGRCRDFRLHQERTKPLSSSAPGAAASSIAATDAIIPISDPGVPAYQEQPPHAGCHFRPTHPGIMDNNNGKKKKKHKGPRKKKRFFEGWYYRVTIPGESVSFAFIFSIEDPRNKPSSRLSLSCHQVMGPNDEYLVQSDPDHTKFWAWSGQQALGCTFEYNENNNNNNEKAVGYCNNSDLNLRTALHPDEEWNDVVKSGFQMLPNRLQGKLFGHDGSLGGVGSGQGIPGECSYDIQIEPLAGWGDEQSGQKSTAGWLANYQVFEPHWQVTMADARATGVVTWKGKKYTFSDAPFYAEKNWGGMFPIKWYWTQCNSFEGYMDRNNRLAVTAGGGTRKIPLGQTESLGMVSVHYNGTFYEAVPWTGTMEWDITEWGQWIMKGRCTKGSRPFEVEIKAICEAPGVKLRAPTEKDGMVYFCRDSFLADTTLSLWELQWDSATKEYIRGKTVIDAARSMQGAVEVGGGPWWDTWKGLSVMKQPMKGLVRLPYRFSNLRKRLRRR